MVSKKASVKEVKVPESRYGSDPKMEANTHPKVTMAKPSLCRIVSLDLRKKFSIPPTVNVISIAYIIGRASDS
jgi:hypothetical protein